LCVSERERDKRESLRKRKRMFKKHIVCDVNTMSMEKRVKEGEILKTLCQWVCGTGKSKWERERERVREKKNRETERKRKGELERERGRNRKR